MNVEDIAHNLSTMTIEDLRRLNEVVVATIKAKRKVENVVSLVNLTIGQEYRLTGLRDKYNGIIVKLVEIRRSKVVVQYGFRQVIVPASCLQMIQKQPSFALGL
jgi:hypothetical protein